MEVLSYGGGRQTVALLVLIKRGALPKPDRIIIADTGRENPSTWEYRDEIAEPLAQSIGLTIEIAPRSLAYVDLYGHNGDLLLPAWTKTGKLSAFCSDEWKREVVNRYLHLDALGYERGDIPRLSQATVRAAMKLRAPGQRTHWIGFALDERKRVKGHEGRRYPLLELGLTKRDCIQIITDAGLPLPPPSACYMCPNKRDSEWRHIRDNYPDEWRKAVELDYELREEDIAQGHAGVWLHHSRVPLDQANIDGPDNERVERQCGLGLCFI